MRNAHEANCDVRHKVFAERAVLRVMSCTGCKGV